MTEGLGARKGRQAPGVVKVEVGEDELVHVPRSQAHLGQGLLDGDDPPDGVVVQDSLHLPLEEGGAVSGVVEDVAQGGVADQHRPGGGEEHLLRVLAPDQPVFGKVHAPQGQDAHLHGVSR